MERLCWIKPAAKPPNPSTITDLSTSALKVLRALSLRYRYDPQVQLVCDQRTLLPFSVPTFFRPSNPPNASDCRSNSSSLIELPKRPTGVNLHLPDFGSRGNNDDREEALRIQLSQNQPPQHPAATNPLLLGMESRENNHVQHSWHPLLNSERRNSTSFNCDCRQRSGYGVELICAKCQNNQESEITPSKSPELSMIFPEKETESTYVSGDRELDKDVVPQGSSPISIYEDDSSGVSFNVPKSRNDTMHKAFHKSISKPQCSNDNEHQSLTLPKYPQTCCYRRQSLEKSRDSNSVTLTRSTSPINMNDDDLFLYESPDCDERISNTATELLTGLLDGSEADENLSQPVIGNIKDHECVLDRLMDPTARNRVYGAGSEALFGKNETPEYDSFFGAGSQVITNESILTNRTSKLINDSVSDIFRISDEDNFSDAEELFGLFGERDEEDSYEKQDFISCPAYSFEDATTDLNKTESPEKSEVTSYGRHGKYLGTPFRRALANSCVSAKNHCAARAKTTDFMTEVDLRTSNLENRTILPARKNIFSCTQLQSNLKSIPNNADRDVDPSCLLNEPQYFATSKSDDSRTGVELCDLLVESPKSGSRLDVQTDLLLKKDVFSLPQNQRSPYFRSASELTTMESRVSSSNHILTSTTYDSCELTKNKALVPSKITDYYGEIKKTKSMKENKCVTSGTEDNAIQMQDRGSPFFKLPKSPIQLADSESRENSAINFPEKDRHMAHSKQKKCNAGNTSLLSFKSDVNVSNSHIDEDQRSFNESNKKRPSDTNNYGPSKKKIKFQIPYRKDVESSKHGFLQQLGTSQLKEEIAEHLAIRLSCHQPTEIALTILYAGGFCQMNKPTTTTTTPVGLAMRINWPNSDEYFEVSLKREAWISSFLQVLLSGKCRKICFDAQEMFQLLIDKFVFHPNEVSSRWLLLDPLVGCWLLNPDHPVTTFTEVAKILQISQEVNGNIKQLLLELSQCVENLYGELTKNGLWKLFLHIEMRVTPILACMELQGIEVNTDQLHELSDFLQIRLSSLQKEAHKAAGKIFQLTSPQQLRVILYDELKLDTKHNIKVKGTDKRQEKSTSEAMLVQFKDVHPLPGIILQFRHLHKLKSTYVDAVLGHVSGRILYTRWEQTSAATGRISSAEPNLQAVPKQPALAENGEKFLLRSVYVARAGYSFVAADFQHIELRVFAHVSKDGPLIKVFHQSKDIFKDLAQKWLECETINDVSSDDREKTKRIVYALMYGAGPAKLVEFLHVSHEEANVIYSRFTSMFPGLRGFSQKIVAQCRKQGYLATESGRRRWFPNINSYNTGLRLHAERQAVNFIIQGSAADLCKCAMVQTQRELASYQELEAEGATLSARLILQIHDELLWEVPESDVSTTAGVIQKAMEEAASICPNLADFSVPLPVVVKHGKTWAEMDLLTTTILGSMSQATQANNASP